MKLISLLTLFFFISGCTSTSDKERIAEDEYWEYVKEVTVAMKKPTPSSVEAGAIWNFIYLNSDKEIIRTLTVRLTNEEIRMCSPKSALKMEILSESVDGKPKSHVPTTIAAYSVLGSRFHFALDAMVCDGSRDVYGNVDELGFIGEESISNWFCPEIEKCPGPIYNMVVGAPVKPNKPL